MLCLGEESEKSPSPEDERAPELKIEETAAPETKEQAADEAVKAEEEEEAEDVKDVWDAESEEEEEEEEDKTKGMVVKALPVGVSFSCLIRLQLIPDVISEHALSLIRKVLLRIHQFFTLSLCVRLQATHDCHSKCF